jgi:predicted Rossmann fold flavoprotein
LIYKTAVIGAGASGLMFVSNLKNKEDVVLIEKNNFIGEKIRISGGGKCNITNREISTNHYLGNSSFIESVFRTFPKSWIFNFCKKHGFSPKLSEQSVSGSYFCKDSKDILTIFKKEIKKEIKKVQLFFNREVLNLEFENGNFKIETNKGVVFAEKVIVASGGLSFQNLGATPIAFQIAEKFGHKIQKLNPALVGFTVQKEQFWFKNLSGISISAKAKIGEKYLSGNILFTHKGCSGPLILNSSLYWEKGKIEIDFLPNKKIENYLKGNGQISSTLPLPKRFLKEFLNSVSLQDKSVKLLNSDEVKKLGILKRYTFSPAGNFGYSRAEVTKGGISTDEINSETLESKLQKSLYFLGEALDITGEVGGYNFHFAFGSAIKCASTI